MKSLAVVTFNLGAEKGQRLLINKSTFINFIKFPKKYFPETICGNNIPHEIFFLR